MIERVGIIVPACNEEANIDACLASIQVAIAAVGPPCHIVVIADSCTDATVERARSFPGVHIMVVDVGAIGAARALGVRRLLEGTRTPAERLWIANTDADAVVPENWLSSQVTLADNGCDVIIGTVRSDAADPSAERRRSRHRRYSAGDESGRVRGANLGVRASAYCAAGSFLSSRGDEDAALVAALSDFRVVTSDEAEVVLSARDDARLPAGYAQFVSRGPTPLPDDAPATA